MPDARSERPVRHRTGARVVVVAGDEVLLQADTDPGVPGSRFWQVPGGGVDAGESLVQAAVRELFEETGLLTGRSDLEGPIATRTVTHGYSDRVLIQEETFFLLRTLRFDPVDAALTEAERRRRVETRWFRLDALPGTVWPAQLRDLAGWTRGGPADLGDVEESTVPVG